MIAPPQAPLEWNHSAEDITKLTMDAMEEYRKVLDAVGGLDAKDCTFESASFHGSLFCIPSLLLIAGVCRCRSISITVMLLTAVD